MRKPAKGGLVYSTDSGRMCPSCRQAVAGCLCKQQTAPAAAAGGKVRVSCETKGRGGKAVTLVRGLSLGTVALADLGKQLRTLCGTGGTVKDGVVELQGDHVERVMAHLKSSGQVVVRTGG